MYFRKKKVVNSDQRNWKYVYRGLAIALSYLLLSVVMPSAQAGREINQDIAVIRHNGQEVVVSKPTVENEKDEQKLEPGKPKERNLTGGQSHSYYLTLREGQFLQVVVDQRGIDVVITLFGPNGAQLVEVDGPNGAQGPEHILLVIDVNGDYQLRIRPLKRDAALGRYEVKIARLQVATELDRGLAEAFKFFNDSMILLSKRKYAEAIPLAEHALAARNKVLGPGYPEIVMVLDHLANLHMNRSDYVKAEPLYRRASEIREKELGGDHLEVANSLNNLAELYRAQRAYAQAEPLFQRALEIREKALGSEHVDVAASLNNLALLYQSKGEFARAEPLYLRALKIFERTNPLEVYRTLNNLANLYRTKGDYDRAELHYRRALDASEKTLGPNHPDVAGTLTNLAALFRLKGDYNQAEQFYRRALEILEKAYEPDHPIIATTLNNLAILYRNNGDYAQAEPLFQRVLTLRKKAPGPEHPLFATSLNSLAILYSERGDYARAEPLFQRSLEILEKAFGPNHHQVAEPLNSLASMYEAKGEIAQAVAYLARASEIDERDLALNMATGSEREKLAYLATLSGKSELNISLHISSAPQDPGARDLALTFLLRRKGRALDAMSESIANLRRHADPQDRILFDELRDITSQLSRLVLGGPQRITLTEYQKRIKSLEEQKEKLESEICRRSDIFRAQSQAITIAAVQSAIPADAALVEYYVYYPLIPKGPRPNESFGRTRYLAYILRHQGEAQWVDLGEASAIEGAVDAWRMTLRDPSRRNVKEVARSLEEMVMRPVRSRLGETRRVLISPDGMLNLIPFAALVDEQNRYLVERYQFTYLTSGRDLLRLQSKTESKQEPLVVANPNFGKTTDRVAEHQADIAQREFDLSKAYFSPLPGTAREAKALKHLLPDATVLTGDQATEAAIKQADSPNILHIATHGFFLNDALPQANRSRNFYYSDRELTQPEAMRIPTQNPLLRSGLVLAGANLRKNSDDDGILTALEVTGMNLWGTKLVVLSACDSGVGEVKTGDGVYGLRRALLLAGSETQVMTLWPVSDKSTSELMIDYYKALQAGQGRSDALRQVQLKMLSRPNRKHPYYWAGFIQSGEWGNLDGKR